MQQETSRLFMVRPAHFGYNEQTALSNTFQNPITDIEHFEVKVLQEFDSAVATLRAADIDVWVIDDTIDIIKPDAVFPNNWISTHEDGTVILYPMLTPNRRAERRKDVVESLQKNYQVAKIIDLSSHESTNEFLEGTGSIVFDHTAKLAYACISPRTHLSVLEKLCTEIGYSPITFRSIDKKGVEVYHTNVIMGIANDFALVCLESIPNVDERTLVSRSLTESGKEVIAISLEQVSCFGGNVLSVKSRVGKNYLALSQKAFSSLSPHQIEAIEQYTNLLPISIPLIETIGGGSVRCMLAQNFLKKI
jgi:hypothetical protein